jgi:glycosyltransferase involved in cell wall biosynthesis
MKICMVVYDLQEFGGLEELVINSAVGLKHLGHQPCIFSTAYVSPNNQFYRRLKENKIPYVQLPKWVSYPASNWPTKQRIIDIVIRLCSPVIFLLAGGVFLIKRKKWAQSYISARGWIHKHLLDTFIGPDHRKPFAQILLNRWVTRWQPDLLHLHGYTENLLFVIEWAYKKKLPIVYEEHQTPSDQFDWWKNFKHTINKSTVVIAVSEKSAESLKLICGVTKPIFVVPPLVPDPYKNFVNRNNNQNKQVQNINITTVARLWITKGLSFLVEAIAKVTKVHPNVRFRVYGDGPLRTELLAKAKEFGLDGEDIFVGSFTDRKELSNILGQTDVFVLPSILEGQPAALIEAMACGLPIVSTSVGGIPELIQDGVNGLLCNPGDPEDLARKISIMLNDDELRLKLGCEARRTYEDSPFEPITNCQLLLDVYKEVMLAPVVV